MQNNHLALVIVGLGLAAVSYYFFIKPTTATGASSGGLYGPVPGTEEGDAPTNAFGMFFGET
jgi:hypothetical protein